MMSLKHSTSKIMRSMFMLRKQYVPVGGSTRCMTVLSKESKEEHKKEVSMAIL